MALNLEVPLEMVAYGVSNNTGSAITYARTRINLDTNDYDGATYYFEVIGTADNTSSTTIQLINSAGSAVTNSSITMPASTLSSKRLRSNAITLTSGADNYRVQIGAVANNGCNIYVARIIVVQASATKTRIQIPLIGATWSNTGTSDTQATDTTTSASYAQNDSTIYSLWNFQAANFVAPASTNPFSLETIMSTGSGATTIKSSLFNATDNTQITGSEQSVATATVTNTVTNFSSDTNFLTNKDYELRIQRSAGSGAANLHFAAFYIRLTNLTTAEVYYRVIKEISATGNAQPDTGRFLYTAANWTTPVIYYEATAYSSVAGTMSSALYDVTTTDSGATGSDVTGSSVTISGATKARFRSGSLTLTDNDRFIEDTQVSSGTLQQPSSWAIFDIPGTTTSTSTSSSTSTTSSTSTSSSSSTSSSTTTTSTSTTTTTSTSTSSTTSTTTSTSSSSSTSTSSTTSTTISITTSTSTSTTTTSTSSSTSTTTTLINDFLNIMAEFA